MNEPPRPSSLGEILDRTANFYRSRFLVFFGIAVVPTAVVLVFASAIFLLVAWSGSAGKKPPHPAIFDIVAIVILVGFFLVLFLIFVAAMALASAAMSHAVARFYVGATITIRQAYKAVSPRFWRYTGLYLLEALFVWILPGAVAIGLLAGSAVLARKAGMGAAGSTMVGLLTFLVFAALGGFALWMLLELSLAFPACVVEQIRPWPAIKRSFSLTKGTMGRIFLLYLLGGILNWLISISVTIPMTIVMALLPGANNPQHAQTAAMILLFVVYGSAFAVQSLTKPVYGIALILFYYDQRIRQEGFDIEWMMQRAGLVSPQPFAPGPAAPESSAPQSSELQPSTDLPPQSSGESV
jgi:hypothetical protein